MRLTADEPLRKKLIDLGFKSGKNVKLIKSENEIFTCRLGKKTIELPLNEAATIWIQQPPKN